MLFLYYYFSDMCYFPPYSSDMCELNTSLNDIFNSGAAKLRQ